MMVSLIIAIAALGLTAVLLWMVRGLGGKVSRLDDLEGQTQPVDLLAFRNLIDPNEEDFLRQNLPAGVFRGVQRKRMHAAAGYVRRVAHNAGVLVRVGQAASRESREDVARIGRDLVSEAVRLRMLALLAVSLLYLRMALPGGRVTLLRLPGGYEHLVDCLGQLARLQRPALAGRILSSV